MVLIEMSKEKYYEISEDYTENVYCQGGGSDISEAMGILIEHGIIELKIV